jgi:LAO/AO transport system kinase
MSKKELIKNRIKEKASDQKISCPALRRLAEELGISYKEAGQLANELKIKIKNCDLGCF